MRENPLLPLDRGGRLGGDVVNHAVHAADLVDDFVRHVGEEFVGQMHPCLLYTSDAADE